MSWLTEPAAQTALLRVLMAVYPIRPEGISPEQHTKLKGYITGYFKHVEQKTTVPQDNKDAKMEDKLIKQAAANCLSQLSKSQASPGKTISNTPINIAERGWQVQYPDDINLYCYLQGYQSAKSEDKPEFLMAIARYTHPAHKCKAKLSCWGETVLRLLPTELLSDTHRQTPSTFKPGTFRMAAVTMILGGQIRGDAAYIKAASNIQNESADRHAKRLNNMVKEHKLFDRWETQIAKFDFKSWLDDGITVEADYLRGDHVVSYIQENPTPVTGVSTPGK